jgi:hypothetical protein
LPLIEPSTLGPLWVWPPGLSSQALATPLEEGLLQSELLPFALRVWLRRFAL